MSKNTVLGILLVIGIVVVVVEAVILHNQGRNVKDDEVKAEKVKSPSWHDIGKSTSYSVQEIDGHKYIVVHGDNYYGIGVSVVHAESCPCRCNDFR